MRQPKYHARRCRCAQGHPHGSGAEARYCEELHLLMRSKENRAAPECERITEIEAHKTVDLPYGVTWRIDFRLTYADGHCEYVEYKGYPDREYLLKRRMFDATHPDAPVRIVEPTRRRRR